LPLRDSLRRWPRRCSGSLLLIPFCTVLLIVVLGLFKLNGSSIGLVAEAGSSPQAALQLRPNRSDEWRGRTPLVLRQAANDFAAQTDVGIGIHDTGVLSDLPVKSAGSVVKPHSWLYFVMNVEHAFAMEWWLTVLGPFLGVYSLMAILTRTRVISALTGLLVAAAPVATWWTVPSMGMSVLYGGLCATSFIAALHAPGRSRFVYAALSGWLLGCFAALLYLPWLIPLGLVFGAVALSQLRGHLRDWRPLVAIVATGGGVFAIGMLLYLRDHRAALSAITNSVYPGKRITTSGVAVPGLVFDAPMDVFTTTRPAPLVFDTNTSEAASGLMLWLPIAIAGGAFGGFRSRNAVPRALAAVMTVALVLAAWAFLPIPNKLGLVLGLTSVQGYRVVLPLTVASALAAGLYVHQMHTDGSFRPARNRILIATVAFVGITATLLTKFVVDNVVPPRRDLIVLMLVLFILTWAVLDGRTLLGLGGACLLLLFSAVRVNPLQVGLGPITASPLTAQIAQVRSTDPTGRWAVAGLDTPSISILMASGAPSATGVSWYADPAEWDKLDPTGAKRSQWDRFAYVDMVVDDTATAPIIDLPFADAINIYTPSCNGALQALSVRYVVSRSAIASSCLHIVASPTKPGERFIYSTS
jgi:hypothetical protein